MRRLSLSKVAPLLLDGSGEVMQTRCPDEIDPDQGASLALLPLAGEHLFSMRTWRATAIVPWRAS